MELEDLLKETIARLCSVPLQDLHGDTRLDSLGVDSLAVAEIIVDMEIALETELPIDVLRRLDRVQTVDDVVHELRAVLADSSTISP